MLNDKRGQRLASEENSRMRGDIIKSSSIRHRYTNKYIKLMFYIGCNSPMKAYKSLVCGQLNSSSIVSSTLPEMDATSEYERGNKLRKKQCGLIRTV